MATVYWKIIILADHFSIVISFTLLFYTSDGSDWVAPAAMFNLVLRLLPVVAAGVAVAAGLLSATAADTVVVLRCRLVAGVVVLLVESGRDGSECWTNETFRIWSLSMWNRCGGTMATIDSGFFVGGGGGGAALLVVMDGLSVVVVVVVSRADESVVVGRRKRISVMGCKGCCCCVVALTSAGAFGVVLVWWFRSWVALWFSALWNWTTAL